MNTKTKCIRCGSDNAKVRSYINVSYASCKGCNPYLQDHIYSMSINKVNTKRIEEVIKHVFNTNER